MSSAKLFRPRSLNNLSILLLALIINSALFLVDPIGLQAIRNHLFDQYQRWQPRVYQDVDVRIIDIDDTSLKMLGQWPWPRSRIAAFLEILHDRPIKALGFDFIFAEPDRTSPVSMSKLWEIPPELQAQLLALPDHDQLFANASQNLPMVLGFTAEQGPTPFTPRPQPFRIIQQGQSAPDFIPGFQHTIANIAILETHAAGNGSLNFLPDIDGLVRKTPTLIRVQNQIYPSFAAELVRVSSQQTNYLVQQHATTSLGIESLKIANYLIPTQANAEMWIYYTPSVAMRTIPIWQIITHAIPLNALDNKILIVGTSAKGLADLRFSPVSGVIPGVEIHAQAVEQILTHSFLLRPAWAKGLEFIILVASTLLLSWLAIRKNIIISLSYSMTLLLSLAILGGYAFSHWGWLIDTLTPSLMALALFILFSFIRHNRTEQRQRWVKEVFSRYVSPNLVKYLIEHPGQIELNAQRRECSFVLTDLANSTPFMEATDPAVVATCLNAYLDHMIAIAFSFEGTLTRIIGDGIVILFSAPIVQADHHQRAIECALAMQQFAQAYIAELNSQGIAFCATRIGVNSGQVLVGNFGGNSIFDYRALGDPINTASRLESVNRYIGTAICVAADCFTDTHNLGKRPIGQLQLKGKSSPLLAYEPLSAASNGALSDPAYEHAYTLLTTDPKAAAQAFAALAQARPNDPLVAFHLQRLQKGEQGDIIVFAEK